MTGSKLSFCDEEGIKYWNRMRQRPPTNLIFWIDLCIHLVIVFLKAWVDVLVLLYDTPTELGMNGHTVQRSSTYFIVVVHVVVFIVFDRYVGLCVPSISKGSK